MEYSFAYSMDISFGKINRATMVAVIDNAA